MKMIWICFISGFILLFFTIKISITAFTSPDKTVEIKGVLKEDITIRKGRRGSRTLVILLKEYPEIKFEIGNIATGKTYVDELMSEKKANDSLHFSIENKEFKSKILKSEKVPFPDNYLRKNTIDILAVHQGSLQYLTLEDYHEVHQKNRYLMISFFGGLALLMLFAGIKGAQYYKNHYR